MEQIQFPNRCVLLCFLEYRAMDKVQNPVILSIFGAIRTNSDAVFVLCLPVNCFPCNHHTQTCVHPHPGEDLFLLAY
jgi:hypothetical protein